MRLVSYHEDGHILTQKPPSIGRWHPKHPAKHPRGETPRTVKIKIKINLFFLSAIKRHTINGKKYSCSQNPLLNYIPSHVHKHTILFKVPHHSLQSTTPFSSKYHTTLYKVPYHSPTLKDVDTNTPLEAVCALIDEIRHESSFSTSHSSQNDVKNIHPHTKTTTHSPITQRRRHKHTIRPHAVGAVCALIDEIRHESSFSTSHSSHVIGQPR